MTESDFDKFLLEATEEEGDIRKRDALIAEVGEKFINGGFAQVYDPDPEVNADRYDRYIMQFVERHYSNPRAVIPEATEIPDDMQGRIDALVGYGEIEAGLRHMRENQIVNIIANLMFQANNGEPLESLTEQKKSFIATLVVDGMELSDPALQFFNDEAPGDKMTESDHGYFVEALENLSTLADMTEVAQKASEMIMERFREAGYELDVSYIIIAQTIALKGLASQMLLEHYGPERSRAKRDEDVLRICLEAGISIDIQDPENLLTQISAILDDACPLT